jgi:hypothetical protein
MQGHVATDSLNGLGGWDILWEIMKDQDKTKEERKRFAGTNHVRGVNYVHEDEARHWMSGRRRSGLLSPRSSGGRCGCPSGLRISG